MVYETETLTPSPPAAARLAAGPTVTAIRVASSWKLLFENSATARSTLRPISSAVACSEAAISAASRSSPNSSSSTVERLAQSVREQQQPVSRFKRDFALLHKPPNWIPPESARPHPAAPPFRRHAKGWGRQMTRRWNTPASSCWCPARHRKRDELTRRRIGPRSRGSPAARILGRAPRKPAFSPRPERSTSTARPRSLFRHVGDHQRESPLPKLEHI